MQTMKLTTGLVLASLTFLGLTNSAEAQARTMSDLADAEAASRSIEELVSRYEAAWNAHDMAAWEGIFTPDSDFVNRGGGWWRPRTVNVERHVAIHEILTERGVVMDLQARKAAVDFLAPGVALVHVRTVWPGAGTPADGNGPPEAIMTWVVVERAGQWRIRALQNTLVDLSPSSP